MVVALCTPPGATAEPVNTDELAIYNCPPTAFTASFSNTAVDNVPLILAFSTSKNQVILMDYLIFEKSK